MSVKGNNSDAELTLKKIAEVFKLVFDYSIMLVLFAGCSTFFGYVVALMIGGETAIAILQMDL